MTVGFRSSNTAVATANSADVTITPTGAQAGDLLIVWACQQATPTWTANQVVATSPDVVSSRTNDSLAVWTHVMTSADIGKAITLTSSLPVHRSAAGCIVLTGASGIDVFGVSNGNSNSVDCPSVVTTHDHDAIVTIGAEQANTARTWTGWAGSTVGPAAGNGSGGIGGIEFASFYKLDQGTKGATGTLSQTVSTPSGWAGVTLGILAAGTVTVDLGTGQDLAAQAGMTATLGITRAGTSNNLWYAKANGTWGVLVPKNAHTDGTWS